LGRLLNRSRPPLDLFQQLLGIDGLGQIVVHPRLQTPLAIPFHKIRAGDYRIVYEIQDVILLILIIKIGHRKDIYRNLT
jgi:mRNA interferase RelE/StbE